MISVYLVLFYLFFFWFNGDLKKVTNYTILIIFCFFYFVIGTIHYELENGFNDSVLSVHVFMLSLCFFCFIHTVLKNVFKSNSSSKLEIKRNDAVVKLVIYFVTIISMTMLIYQSIFLNPFAIGGELESARVNVVFENKLIFYNLLLLSPILMLLNFSYSLKIRWLFALLVVIASLVTGFRSILLNIFLISLVYFFVINNKNFTQYFKSIAIAFMILISFATFVTFYRISGDDASLLLAFDILLDRLFVLNLRNIENIINYHEINGLWFGYAFFSDFSTFFARMLSVFGAERLPTYAEYITSALNPSGDRRFVMTPTIIGVGYADFGYLGGFLNAFIIFLLSLSISHLNRDRLSTPFYCYFVLCLGVMATRGIPATFVLYFLPVLFFLFFLKFIRVFI